MTKPIETDDFPVTVQSFMDAELTYDEIIKKTDSIENFFLKTSSARAIWHGVAYLKINDKEKNDYKTKYNLKPTQIKQWAAIVKIWGSGNGPLNVIYCISDKKIPVTAFMEAVPLARMDKEKADSILIEAMEKGHTSSWIREECLTAKQQLEIEKKAERIKGSSKEKITIADARREAERVINENRRKKAFEAKKKAYEKAKKIVEVYEKSTIQKSSKIVSTLDAEKALKLLYRTASKAAHSDTGNGNDKDMTQVNLAKETVSQFIKTWR